MGGTPWQVASQDPPQHQRPAKPTLLWGSETAPHPAPNLGDPCPQLPAAPTGTQTCTHPGHAAWFLPTGRGGWWVTAAGTRDEPALDGTSAPARCQPACHGKMPTSSQYRSTMPTTSPSHGRMPTLPFHQGAMPIMPGLPDPPHAELVLGCLLAASSDVPQSRPGAPSALHSPIPPNPKMGRKRGKKNLTLDHLLYILTSTPSQNTAKPLPAATTSLGTRAAM